MAILDQVKGSQLSKQGLTSPTGIFEGTPENVAIVERGYSVPNAATIIAPTQNPIDVTFNSRKSPTYLDYLRSVKR